ncbi:MAG: guanylate kinase [Chloroflexota bacterium]|nr:guanylate kinase [Chloroflexota bacterium]
MESLNYEDARHPSPKPPLLIVLSGPSGAGKDSVIEELRKGDGNRHFVVTATTRPPRPGETDGVDYIFLDEATFLEMRRNQELLESAQYSGRWYGVPRSQVSGALNAGRDVFLKIEVQGAETIRSIAPEAVLVFLAPPSVAELARRLAQRRTEDPAELQRRLDIARQELEEVGRYDYCVVNRDGCLDQAVSEIEAIIAAEKCRVEPRRVVLD